MAEKNPVGRPSGGARPSAGSVTDGKQETPQPSSPAPKK
jgi:hypothetical protein